MMPVLFSLLLSLRSSFRVRAALQAEILALRHQFLVLQRANRNHRLELSAGDRRLWVWLSRFWLGWRSALLDRETGNRHRLAPQGLSPLLDLEEPGSERSTIYTQEIRDLIRRMSLANPHWGAPRIHGELLKLGIQVSQGTVAKYIVRLRRPPSQTWKTFLKNHAKDLASTDFFVVPTVTSQGSRLDGHSRGIDGSQSPWQNSYVERLIGSIRRECLDHVIVLSEVGLRRVRKTYFDYSADRERTWHSANTLPPIGLFSRQP